MEVDLMSLKQNTAKQWLQVKLKIKNTFRTKIFQFFLKDLR
jgi:hypothetical protein